MFVPVREFFSQHRDILRRVDADAALPPVHANNNHFDLVADDDSLADPTRDDEHGGAFVP